MNKSKLNVAMLGIASLTFGILPYRENRFIISSFELICISPI